MVVQMAISRTREYSADNLGARICGQPLWLASALVKIDNAAHQIPNMEAERSPATAHMFIINPLSGQGMDNLFSTHPSTENRVRWQVAGMVQYQSLKAGAASEYPKRNLLTTESVPAAFGWGCAVVAFIHE